MNLCDLSLGKPETDLACDEALLDLCEEEGGAEWLRLWQPAQHFVVVGYANSVAREVNVEFCARRGIPIHRRCTGGGAVLQGPGALNYSVVLRIDGNPDLRSISSSNQYILARQRKAVAAALGASVEARGHTDLVLDNLKVSGNAQRRRRHFLLFHGCFLLNMDLSLIEQALPFPSKQPDYRLNRSHGDFLLNLHASADKLKRALADEWGANDSPAFLPMERVERLAREKYSRPEWNLRF